MELRDQLSRSKQNPNANGSELTKLFEDFLNNYQSNGIIEYSEAEHFLSDYRDFKQKLNQIEESLTDDNRLLELVQEFNDLRTLYRWGEQYKLVRQSLWSK